MAASFWAAVLTVSMAASVASGSPSFLFILGDDIGRWKHRPSAPVTTQWLSFCGQVGGTLGITTGRRTLPTLMYGLAVKAAS